MAGKPMRFALKRLMDIAGSLSGLGLLAVPFALIALVIKSDSPGPVFFKQERIGRGGKRFLSWKFRTMIVHQDKSYKISRDDPRITRVGRVLRKWGLDELPQLFNVLGGQMSLVGPRALPYPPESYGPKERRRLLVKPGLTGWVVVNGRNRLSWEERIRLDLWYVDHFSLWLDLVILLRTLWVVLVTHEGLYGPGGVNEELTPAGSASGEEPAHHER